MLLLLFSACSGEAAPLNAPASTAEPAGPEERMEAQTDAEPDPADGNPDAETAEPADTTLPDNSTEPVFPLPGRSSFGGFDFAVRGSGSGAYVLIRRTAAAPASACATLSDPETGRSQRFIIEGMAEGETAVIAPGFEGGVTLLSLAGTETDMPSGMSMNVRRTGDILAGSITNTGQTALTDALTLLLWQGDSYIGRRDNAAQGLPAAPGESLPVSFSLDGLGEDCRWCPARLVGPAEPAEAAPDTAGETDADPDEEVPSLTEEDCCAAVCTAVHFKGGSYET